MTSNISLPVVVYAPPVSVAHSDFTAAAATETINIWTIPPKAQVLAVVCAVTETPDDTDGDLTNWSLEFGEDDTPDVDAFLTSHDYIADAPGVIESTRGAALTTTQGMYSTSASKNLTCTATVVGVNLNDADIDAGGWDIYITYVQYA
jgi:hypothetical protein